MMPPGLAFVSVSDKAWKVIEKNPSPRVFYFDLKKAREKLPDSDTPYTPAHTLLRAMRLSLKRIRDEGLHTFLRGRLETRQPLGPASRRWDWSCSPAGRQMG